MSTLFLTDEETEPHQHEIRPAPPRQIPQQQPSNFCNDNSKEESVKVLSAMFPVLSETVISDAFDFCKGDSNQVVKCVEPKAFFTLFFVFSHCFLQLGFFKTNKRLLVLLKIAVIVTCTACMPTTIAAFPASQIIISFNCYLCNLTL